MLFVTGLDHTTADRHFRPRAAVVPAGLDARSDDTDISGDLKAAIAAGRFRVETEPGDQRVTVAWNDPAFGAPVIGSAITRAGYGSILLGEHATPRFDPKPIARPGAAGRHWPLGEDVGEPGPPPAAMEAALDAFLASSSGVYGVLIATPNRVLVERYSVFGGADRATPSWSMTKAITCTVIGRLIHDGWLGSVHDPAPAPLWRDPRGIHRLITLDHLMRMRSGLGFPVRLDDGGVVLGFENSAVYQDGVDAFEAAQRSVVAAIPGSVFRYVNSGMNVLGSVIQDQIMRRGLPYHETVYGLLADRLGMSSYQHSADIAGNFIASGAGYATPRDYAKLGVLYLQDGVWNGERLLPEGWVDYALTATHTGTSYAACFRTNTDRLFPDLPEDTAWAAGASDNRVFILRRHGLTVAVTNETDHKMDLGALNRLIATAIDTFA
jgi:CubicO group peptidase (beta-lactamase class C family)